MAQLPEDQRIVITGIGLAAPNADNLGDYRSNLLAGKSGIREIELRYVGKVPAGICTFPETKYRKKKENKRCIFWMARSRTGALSPRGGGRRGDELWQGKR